MERNKEPTREMRATRIFRAQLGESEKGVIDGYASVYNQKTNIGDYFYEVIERGAFDQCDLRDVLFFMNHDDSKITLARSRQDNPDSTMEITPDDKGLRFKANLDYEENVESKIVLSSVRRKDVDGMSFAFYIDECRWEDLDSRMPTRYITKIKKVYEISVVNLPAYEGTSIYARNKNSDDVEKKALEEARAKHRNLKLLKEKAKIGGIKNEDIGRN